MRTGSPVLKSYFCCVIITYHRSWVRFLVTTSLCPRVNKHLHRTHRVLSVSVYLKFLLAGIAGIRPYTHACAELSPCHLPGVARPHCFQTDWRSSGSLWQYVNVSPYRLGVKRMIVLFELRAWRVFAEKKWASWWASSRSASILPSRNHEY